MAGLMSNIRRRNRAASEAAGAAREARGASTRSRPGPVVGSRNRQKGLRAVPAKRTTSPVNRPKAVSEGTGRRQQRIRDIEARIKALGG